MVICPGAPAYFGDYYRFQIDRQIYPIMTGLDAGLAGDEAGLKYQSMSGWLSEADDADDFSRAQHAGSTGPAMMLAKSLDLGGAEKLLDVAGGTGAYSIAFCEKFPDLTATIIDFPSVIDVAAGFVGDAGMTERIALVGGDALKTPWPEAQGVVLMSYLLSAVGGGDIAELLERSWNALRPGGRLLLHDFMLDDDRSGPVSTAAFFMTYLAMRTDPVSFTGAQVGSWAEERGFVDIRCDIMIPEITKIVTATKP
ncbi:MAG: methyltransferase [Alphaproteobacteria bacterium]|nr:methyltransferase [Alphaproteobacteria bacterium]